MPLTTDTINRDPNATYTFEHFTDFLGELPATTPLRLVVEPDEVLRGRNSYQVTYSRLEAHNPETLDTGTEYEDPTPVETIRDPEDATPLDEIDAEITEHHHIFSGTETVEGRMGELETVETEYRIAVPTSGTISKQNIPVEHREVSYDDNYDWLFCGYLSNAGVLKYFDDR